MVFLKILELAIELYSDCACNEFNKWQKVIVNTLLRPSILKYPYVAQTVISFKLRRSNQTHTKNNILKVYLIKVSYHNS